MVLFSFEDKFVFSPVKHWVLRLFICALVSVFYVLNSKISKLGTSNPFWMPQEQIYKGIKKKYIKSRYKGAMPQEQISDTKENNFFWFKKFHTLPVLESACSWPTQPSLCRFFHLHASLLFASDSIKAGNLRKCVAW